MTAAPKTHDNDWRAAHGLLLFGLITAATFVPAFRGWPMIWFVPLAGYAALVAVIPPLRHTFRRWRFGEASRPTLMATFVITIGSSSALLAFHHLTHPDVSGYATVLPASKLGGVIAASALFSVVNASCEEVIFRGIFFDALESQWGRYGAALGAALLFGLGHLHGYPPGPLGATLAGVYGLCLGALRIMTGGLGLPVIAHVFADATICVIVVRSGVL